MSADREVVLTGTTYGVSMYAVFSEEAQRDAFVALFPKFVGVRPSRLWAHVGYLEGADWRGADSQEFPTATFRLKALPDGVNGGVNETGVKRLRRLLQVLEASGAAVRWSDANGCRTESETLTRLGLA